MKSFLSAKDKKSIKHANTMADLAKTAELVIKRMPHPVAQVCGPISTGGLGSVSANMKKLKRAIERLSKSGVAVFDQTVFEPQMKKIGKRDPRYLINELLLLEEFYLFLFKKRLITVLYFIPGWESSFGAKWEHKMAKQLKVEIRYI